MYELGKCEEQIPNYCVLFSDSDLHSLTLVHSWRRKGFSRVLWIIKFHQMNILDERNSLDSWDPKKKVRHSSFIYSLIIQRTRRTIEEEWWKYFFKDSLRVPGTIQFSEPPAHGHVAWSGEELRTNQRGMWGIHHNLTASWPNG